MKGINSKVAAPAIVGENNTKRKALPAKEGKPKKIKATAEPKAKKDPNLPKRPPTAFFIFMTEFRKTYKECHPNTKGVAVISKAGGEKWKKLTDKEKEAFVAKATQLKAEYAKALAAYEQKNGSEGSLESKSEVADDAEDSTLDGFRA